MAAVAAVAELGVHGDIVLHRLGVPEGAELGVDAGGVHPGGCTLISTALKAR